MFWLLCFVSCVVKQRWRHKKEAIKWRGEYTCTIVLFVFTTLSFSLFPLGHCVLCKDVFSFVFQTFEDTKHKSQNTKLEDTKLKTSLYKTQCSNGDKLKEKVVNKNRTIVQVYSHRHFYRFLFMSSSRRLTTQDLKHKSQNTKLES